MYTVSSMDWRAPPRTALVPLSERLSYEVVLEKLDMGVKLDEYLEGEELTVLEGAPATPSCDRFEVEEE